MAQPKNRGRRDGDRDGPEKSVHRVELENLSKKAEGIVQKRNDLNAQARQARDDRELLNAKRKELYGKMQEMKAERDAFNQKIHAAKELRGEYQAQAKILIGEKRAKFKQDGPRGEKPQRSPRFRAQELRAEIKDLEYSQQTRVFTIEQENELLKQLRLKQKEYVELRREVDKMDQLKVDLSDADKSIDQLFAKAEEQHQIVVQAAKDGQAAHERFIGLVKEVAAVSAEANRHHKHFIELRQQSDEQHKAFLELREKMLELQGKEWADRNEAKQIIREQRDRVRHNVADPRGLDRHAESVLDQLKRGGKITLGS